jgi:hypothetical protein
MTREEILKLDANPETDALVAVMVMGWQRMSWEKAYKQIGRKTLTPYWHSSDGTWMALVDDNDDVECPQNGWHPTVDISASCEVMEKFASQGYGVHVYRHGDWNDKDGKRYWQAYMDFSYPKADADTISLAICRAALLAILDN